MKFYVVTNYYFVGLNFKFHGDLCSNARARVVNARTRDKTCTRAFTPRARAFMQVVLYYCKFASNRAPLQQILVGHFFQRPREDVPLSTHYTGTLSDTTFFLKTPQNHLFTGLAFKLPYTEIKT